MRVAKIDRRRNEAVLSHAIRQVPALRFSPAAWAKLLYLRDLGETEIGGFGISAPDEPFYISDWRLVPQTCSACTVRFHDDGVADYFDEQVDAGLAPHRFSRVWIHTHPGDCPQPSRTDEETFQRVFGPAHWSLMFILARGGATYGRLRFNVGAQASVEVPVHVDYAKPFGGSEFAAWRGEYERCVQPIPEAPTEFLQQFNANSGDQRDNFPDWRPHSRTGGPFDEYD